MMINFLFNKPFLVAFLLLYIVCNDLAFAQVNPDRGGNAATIVRAGYDFAPTVMRDVDGTYKMWWCSGRIGSNPQEIDVIRYSTASNVAGPWSTPQTVFTQSNVSGKFDKESVCSPSVVRVNGTYYMYYEGADFHNITVLDDRPASSTFNQMIVVEDVVDGTQFGVASSADGINWTRLNGGNRLFEAFNHPASIPKFSDIRYGAGYPNVSYFDGRFYLFFHDDTGNAAYKTSYILRSPDPLFPPSQTEQLGATGFIPFNSSTYTDYKVRDVVNADIAYHHGLQEFLIGISGVPLPQPLLSTAFFDSNLKTELRLSEVYAEWSQGPGAIRDTHGNFLKVFPDIGYSFMGNLYQSNCSVPIDYMRSVGDSFQDASDLSYVGYTTTVSKRCGDVVRRYRGDFDKDFIADQAIFRPSTGTHFRNGTTTGVNPIALSQPNSIPIKGDFDGDGNGDFGIVYPTGGYLWWVVINSSNGSVRTQPTWGFPGDDIAIADYNGDGKDDFGIYRNGQWFAIYDTGGTYNSSWGLSGDIPVAADYDGDGIDEPAVYRPSNGTWYIRDYLGSGVRTQQWGLNGDIPIPGDFMADGLDDFAVWRPSDGTWYILDNGGVTSETTQWGLSGDVPVAEDFNGDGKLDLSVWRNSNGWWYHNFRNGRTSGNQFGLPGDLIHRVK